jgi:hypothetical protein
MMIRFARINNQLDWSLMVGQKTIVICGLQTMADLHGGQKGHGPPNSIQIYTTILSINPFLPCKIWNSLSWPPQLLANVFWPLLQCWSRSTTACRSYSTHGLISHENLICIELKDLNELIIISICFYAQL